MTSSLATITLLALLSHHVTHSQKNLKTFIDHGCDYKKTARDLNADFVIAGLFPVHTFVERNYRPSPFGITWVESFLYAIDKINNNSTVLPGVRLGYDVRDTCNDVQVATKQTLDFLADTEYYNTSMKANASKYVTASGEECTCVGERDSKLIGVVGA